VAIQTIDPALRRLIDSLPAGDPDAEPECVEVWTDHTTRTAIVAVGSGDPMDLGEWNGPSINARDVVVRARFLGDGTRVTINGLRLFDPPRRWFGKEIQDGDRITVHGTFWRMNGSVGYADTSRR
jgi:hypothetical protein